MEGPPVLNGHYDPLERVAVYRQFDEIRQQELEVLATEFNNMRRMIDTLKSDLDDEKKTRREYKERAMTAEMAISRSQFALVLVDGDGYIFRQALLKAEAGGAAAGHHLYTAVLTSLKDNGVVVGDIDVMVNIFANKAGVAKALYQANVLNTPSELDDFLSSFTQSRSLFQFIDCGYGKERADAKLRDTFRFFAYNVHCRQIFLACTHDIGYVAELAKYSHDPIVQPKTTLVHAALSQQSARAYASLPFPVTSFDSVFETIPLDTKARYINGHSHTQNATNHSWSSTLQDITNETSPASTPAALPAPPPGFAPASLPIRQAAVASASPTPTEVAKVVINEPARQPSAKPAGDAKNGIPVNRAGQRIDLRMRQPSTTEQERFDARISYRKLCNEHHLRDSCYQYNCKYDHDPITEEMKNTLRYKARSIPCATGMKCRRLDCYYGHQCPWGNTNCSNPKCAFKKNGLHDIDDVEVCKFVAAAPA